MAPRSSAARPEAAGAMSNGASPDGIELTFDLPQERCEVLMDRQMFGRVLVNLIENAAQAMRDNRDRKPAIQVRLRREGEFYNLDVDDSGPGIPNIFRESVFDPYFTNKHDGTGLGLAIVKKIVVEHGGAITAGQSDLGG